MPEIVCAKCVHTVPQELVHSVTVSDRSSLYRIHFCSSTCWVEWFKTIPLDTYETIVLPALDGYDIGRAQRAMRKRAA